MSIQRKVDEPYLEETDLPILYRKKLPKWIRFRRWLGNVTSHRSLFRCLIL